MQSNLSINSNSPSFGLKVNKEFIKAAHNYYNGVEYRPGRVNVFDANVRKVEQNYGYDEFEMYHEKRTEGGKEFFRLLVKRDGMKPVLISEKDQFRKIIEKFRRFTKGELYAKIKAAKAEQGITYNPQ
jgi:hypothetical protein